MRGRKPSPEQEDKKMNKPKDIEVYVVIEDYTSAFCGLYTNYDKAREMAEKVGGGIAIYLIDEDGDVLADLGIDEI
jgi:hypothetical protein